MSQPINIVVQLTGLFATVSVPAVQLPSNGNGGSVTWQQVTGKPEEFPPTAHQHVMDDVQGLINALAGKAASIHSHQIADIIGLALALADKANVSDLQNKADLVGGVIPTSQIPAAAITEFLGAVNSESAMLALVGQKGDWCIRTDQNRTYFIVGDNGSVLANWRFIETPASPVTSVNGQVGVIVLGKGDVGLPNVDNTSDMAKPVSTAQAQALAGKANTNHGHAISEITGLQQELNDRSLISDLPIFIELLNAESTSSGSLVSIAGLASPTLPANSSWIVEASLAVTCNATGGIRFGYNCPSDGGAQLNFEGVGASLTAYQQTRVGLPNTLTPVSVQRFQGDSRVTIAGRLNIGATPGIFELMFASGTAGQLSTISTTIGSFVRLTRIV